MLHSLFGYCGTFSIQLRFELGLVGSVGTFWRKTAQNIWYSQRVALGLSTSPLLVGFCLFFFFFFSNDVITAFPFILPGAIQSLQLVSPFLRLSLRTVFCVNTQHQYYTIARSIEQQRSCRKNHWTNSNDVNCIWKHTMKPGEWWSTTPKFASCRILVLHFKLQNMRQGDSSIFSWAHTMERRLHYAIMWEPRMVIAPHRTSRTAKDRGAANSS